VLYAKDSLLSKKQLDLFSSFATDHECDRQTDGQNCPSMLPYLHTVHDVRRAVKICQISHLTILTGQDFYSLRAFVVSHY